MAVQSIWVSTGGDENGEETGYWYEYDDGLDVDVPDWDVMNPVPYTGDWRDYAPTTNEESKKITDDLADSAWWKSITPSDVKTPADGQNLVAKAISAFGDTAGNFLKKVIFKNPDKPEDGLNLAGIGTALAGVYTIANLGKKSDAPTGGYSKPVPDLAAVRAQIPYAADPNRRPGEAGRSYFTDMQYKAPADAAAAQTAANTQAQGIASAYVPKAAAVNPYESGDKAFKTKYNPAATATPTDENGASGVASLLPISARMPVDTTTKTEDEYRNFTTAAHGGLMSFAKGGANYLRGRTDGMADKLNTSIDNRQAAKLSHGEFVIPADVVSHLGNGNSDAGAEKLYQMMAKIRKARTGNPKQGKRINPDKFMPGGLASLNMGGAIGFAGDGTAGSAVTGSPLTTSPGSSTSSNLSPWAGPFVTDMLGEAAGIAKAPYQAYTGPLTAGESDLQQQAFAGAKTVAGAGYDPTKFTSGTFDATQAQQYMNPYLSAVLDPQMKELQRQADITRIGDAGRMTRAGAFGGGRQAIMESEGNRNLLNTQADTLGRGYASAYDKAMGQFNTQADRDMGAQKASEESRQFSANFGLKSLADLERMGATQRQIEGEGIAADKTQFEEARDNPAAMVKFKRDLITGLPMTTSTNAKLPMDSLGQMISSVGGLSQFYAMLKDFGINATPAAGTPPK